MALKTWTTNYPATLDTVANQEPLLNVVDDVDETHPNILSEALRALEVEVGSDALEAGSLRAKSHDQSHALNSADHTACTLSQLNAKVSDNDLVATDDARLINSRTPIAHKTSHENGGGAEEISVAGLSGVLADKQDADKLQGRSISAVAPNNGEIYLYNSGTSTWTAGTPTVTADTASVNLVYSTVALVHVHPWPGKPSTSYFTLQDGIQRACPISVVFNMGTLGEGGRDAGAESADAWYYLYLVPTVADDLVLTVRGSLSDPDTGPTGYSNWKYIGAVRNTSSNIQRFVHATPNRFYCVPRLGHSMGTLTDAAPVSVSLVIDIPDTACEVEVQGDCQMNGAIGNGYMTMYFGVNGMGTTAAEASLYGVPLETDTWSRTTCFGMVPTPASPKAIWYMKTIGAGSISACNLYVRGWTDGYLGI